MQSYEFRGSAAGPGEASSVSLHGSILFEPCKSLLQDEGCSGMRRHNDPVVHPAAFPPHGDEPGAAKVGEVAGDFGLRLTKDFSEVANTDLLVADDVEQAEAGHIPEGLEEPLEVKGCLSWGHGVIVYALTYVFGDNIVALADIFLPHSEQTRAPLCYLGRQQDMCPRGDFNGANLHFCLCT